MHSTLLTIGQLAERLGVSRWRLAYLIEKGILPPPTIQVPGRRLFDPKDVQRFWDALAALEKPATVHQTQEKPMQKRREARVPKDARLAPTARSGSPRLKHDGHFPRRRRMPETGQEDLRSLKSKRENR